MYSTFKHRLKMVKFRIKMQNCDGCYWKCGDNPGLFSLAPFNTAWSFVFVLLLIKMTDYTFLSFYRKTETLSEVSVFTELKEIVF